MTLPAATSATTSKPPIQIGRVKAGRLAPWTTRASTGADVRTPAFPGGSRRVRADRRRCVRVVQSGRLMLSLQRLRQTDHVGCRAVGDLGDPLDTRAEDGDRRGVHGRTGVEKPLRVVREVVAAVKGWTGIVIAIGVGPSRLVVKCCSDPGKPAGFVAMGREEACVRFATAPTCRIPGIGAKTADRLPSSAFARSAPPEGRRGAWRRASARTPRAF